MTRQALAKQETGIRQRISALAACAEIPHNQPPKLRQAFPQNNSRPDSPKPGTSQETPISTGQTKSQKNRKRNRRRKMQRQLEGPESNESKMSETDTDQYTVL